MAEFWKGSGYGLLEHDGDGNLRVTDDFLRAYLERPELAPVEESCDAERALHADLVADPRRAVEATRIDALADPDARENYRVMLAFRDKLVDCGTVEACYFDLFRTGEVSLPAIFVDQMAHVICHNILEDNQDPMRLRAAELLFRSQKATNQEGQILLADEEVVEMYAQTRGFGNLGRLLTEAATPSRSVDLDVLNEDNQEIYWRRSDRYDTVLDLTFARPGLDALCRVLESWVDHFLGVDVNIQPVQSIRDERWAWHVGLDGESSAILNDLYEGKDVDEERLARLLSLFRLEFRDAVVMRPEIQGRPVYLGLAMAPDGLVRLKPQNLLVNLPLGEAT